MRSLSAFTLTFMVLASVPGAGPALAEPDDTSATASLQAEVDKLKEELAALEARVAAQESPPAATEPSPEPSPGEMPAPPPPTPTPAGSSGTPGAAAASKVFNPDISAIGNLIGAAGRSPGGGEPSLELHEAEIGLQSIVDPYARADFFLTFGPDEVGLEEGYVTFPTLPGALLLKVGKMRDAFGKVNGMHSHVLSTADRPIVSRNLLGGEDALADSGISVSRLIPIPGVFLEATGQVYRGESEVFKAPTRGDLAYVGHLRLYRDISEATNVDLGGSLAYGHNGDGPDTTTRLFGADLTFRYKPLRRAIYTHLLARAELVWSRRGSLATPTQDAFGAYGYIEYQVARRWTVAARYDDSERAADATLRDTGGSLVITYAPSEFSQVRGQYRHTRFGERRTADELLLQFQFSIGAHGAHVF
jgi:hypothetical protein